MELTSNQLYGGLNRRFDNRARTLARMGWRYDAEQIAYKSQRKAYYWRRGRQPGEWTPGEQRALTIGNETIMHASRAMWLELLATANGVGK